MWSHLQSGVEYPQSSLVGFRCVEGALRTIDGYEAMHMIRKGQVRWLEKGDVIGQVRFIQRLLGIAA